MMKLALRLTAVEKYLKAQNSLKDAVQDRTKWREDGQGKKIFGLDWTNTRSNFITEKCLKEHFIYY